MRISELVYKTRSYRGFDRSRKLTKQELAKLVNCARLTASSVNRQPLKYYLAWEADEVAKIQSTTSWAKGLPDIHLPHPGKEPTAFIVICLDTEIDSNIQRYARDASIAAYTILLAATEKDLGGCIIGSFQAGELRNHLLLPDRLSPLLVVALGKPDEDVRVVEAEKDGDVNYYRDENDVHYVPKRKLEDIILTRE